jgi:hypothetical protein
MGVSDPSLGYFDFNPKPNVFKYEILFSLLENIINLHDDFLPAP